jgi:hypothetical protein
MKCRECRYVMLDTGMEKYGFIGWCRALANVKPLPIWVSKVAPIADEDIACECFREINETPKTMNSDELLSPYDVTR